MGTGGRLGQEEPAGAEVSFRTRRPEGLEWGLTVVLFSPPSAPAELPISLASAQRLPLPNTLLSI